MIKIRFYGAAKDAVGASRLDFNTSAQNIHQLIIDLTHHYPLLTAIIEHSCLTLNEKVLSPLPQNHNHYASISLPPEAIIEIMPPFAGG